jgi:hypothetical protein
MPANYVLLERIELNASASSVSFQNIPQSGYTDLKIVYSARSNDAVNGWNLTRLQFNTDTTASNYNYRVLGGFGSTAFSGFGTQAVGYTTSGARTANTFNNGEIYIPNYLGSTQKSYSGDSATEENGSTFGILGFHATFWSGTSAINQIILSLDNSASFVQYSTFSLYGLAALGTTPVIAPKASGGNIIDFDGTYWIHTFTSTGDFVPQGSLSCEVLAVAGGGGGGSGLGGGGGAGGMQTATVSLTGSNTVTVGAGGARGESAAATSQGSNGANSTVSSVSATGGGGGGGYQTDGGSTTAAGKAGGSGGGAGVYLTGGNWVTGSVGTGSQGSNGGTAFGTSSQFGLGAGGGNSAVGGNGSANTGGTGGAGTSNSLSGTAVVYAGGGGGAGQSTGGAGGNGGGGAGGSGDPSNGTAGTVNRGGGGGSGRGGTGFGAAGGSGIVIIRYLA